MHHYVEGCTIGCELTNPDRSELAYWMFISDWIESVARNRKPPRARRMDGKGFVQPCGRYLTVCKDVDHMVCRLACPVWIGMLHET